MLDRIFAGIRKREFYLLYQPIVAAASGKPVAVEALLRWGAMEGPIPNSTFLPVAEMTGAIIELGTFALAQACRDALQWPTLKIAVNISAVQLREKAFADRVCSIVRDAGLPFERLELEIVESALIDDFDHAQRELTKLRKTGIGIALDDFGTGYSSLTYLRKLPIDKLKIDTSITADIGTVQSASIVQALVALARAIGLKITAEGVETQEQQRFLRACGCHCLQGYLFSKPVSARIITDSFAASEPALQARA
jgi:EAL domain-containing protein (putative c-di-GMP-specific phosphodiesterase class I)